jgi:hypothetical protein
MHHHHHGFFSHIGHTLGNIGKDVLHIAEHEVESYAEHEIEHVAENAIISLI